jgi:hypothetical protein
MTNQTLLGLAVVFGLIAYGAKQAAAKAGTPTKVNTGPDLIDFEESSRGVKYQHVKSGDTSLTAFPLELWTTDSPNPADGTITKTGIAYATNDTSSYVQFTKTSKGKVSVLRKGIGGFTGAIIKQL